MEMINSTPSTIQVPVVEHETFFNTKDGHHKFAAGMNKVESLLIFPYAARADITLADLNAASSLA